MGSFFAKTIEIEIIRHKTELLKPGNFEKVFTLVCSSNISANDLPCVDCLDNEYGDEFLFSEWSDQHETGYQMDVSVKAKRPGPRQVQLNFSNKVIIKGENESCLKLRLGEETSKNIETESGSKFEALELRLSEETRENIESGSKFEALELRLSEETRKDIESCSKFEAQKKVVFEFELFDNFGDKVTQNLNIKGVQIHAWLKPSGRGYETVKVNKKDKNLNFYQIEFVPKLVGKRELNLEIEGKPVKDCPLCFEVVSAVSSQPKAVVSQIESRIANSKTDVEKVIPKDLETLVLPIASIEDNITEQSQIESFLQDMRIQIDDQEAKIENFEILGDTLSLMFNFRLNIGTHSGTTTKLIKVKYRRKLIDGISQNVVGIKEVENNGNRRHFAIKCKGFQESDVKGPDNSHIDNINRVISIIARSREKNLSPTDIKQTNESIEINFSRLTLDVKTAKQILELISKILEGQNFRSQAWQFDEERNEWKNRAITAYDNKEYKKASFSSKIKEKYGALMCQAHEKASELIFDFHNSKRNQSEIDLHGLLVANDESVEDYRQQLQKDPRYNGNKDLIDEQIKKKCDSDNEAIKKLRERLDEFDINEARERHCTWLEIIVGAGHHSAGNRQKIKPAVEKFLNEQKLTYRVADKGSLLVTFEEYSGKLPCVADFYCNKCRRRWTNGPAWLDVKQSCRRHKNKLCEPFKHRPFASSSNSNNSLTPQEKLEREQEHMSHCEKCQKNRNYCGRN